MSTMMDCGCAANAKRKTSDGWEPCCAIHDSSTPAPFVPDLTGRKARCCGENSIQESSEKLAFFEYRGANSPAAKKSCKHCGYYEEAHEKNVKHCGHFEPRGAWEYDRYYCGCRGWD